VLENGARAQVTEFGLNKGAQVTRRAVLNAKNGAQVVFVLDNHARAHLGRGN
jgi:hypothetical protein